MFGLTIARTKSIPLQPLSGRSSWWQLVSEPFMGAWQRDQEISADTVLAFAAVFACVRLISSDISKLCLRLVEEVSEDIWIKAKSPAFSPVIRRPNRFQDPIQFVASWIISKLTQGNTYCLKGRDQRRVVTSLYVLDPLRVTPLVAQDGSVYYELKRDDLSGQRQETVVVPASEIIHDRGPCLYHPLIGVTPITACGLAALQGMAIQNNTKGLFSRGAIPSGILTAPGQIGDETAARLKATWETNYSGANAGRVAVVGDGLTFKEMTYDAVDSQLIEQLKWSGENVCTAFGVPANLVDIGPAPPYASPDTLVKKYYSQCLQVLIASLEKCLDDGLELPEPYGTEFDIDDLIWMDPEARTKAGAESIRGSLLSINDARRKYLGEPPVKGGESILSQQQYYRIEALAERDASDPFAKPAPAVAPQRQPEEDALPQAASYAAALYQKSIDEGLYAA
jgi:HK97 family phage portal protein